MSREWVKKFVQPRGRAFSMGLLFQALLLHSCQQIRPFIPYCVVALTAATRPRTATLPLRATPDSAAALLLLLLLLLTDSMSHPIPCPGDPWHQLLVQRPHKRGLQRAFHDARGSTCHEASHPLLCQDVTQEAEGGSPRCAPGCCASPRSQSQLQPRAQHICRLRDERGCNCRYATREHVDPHCRLFRGLQLVLCQGNGRECVCEGVGWEGGGGRMCMGGGE